MLRRPAVMAHSGCTTLRLWPTAAGLATVGPTAAAVRHGVRWLNLINFETVV
jgi:hypothetical protein